MSDFGNAVEKAAEYYRDRYVAEIGRQRPMLDRLIESTRPYREEQRLKAFDDGIPRVWVS